MKNNVIYEYRSKPYQVRVSPKLSPIPHLHNSIEIVYVISGKCVAYAGYNRAVMSTGDIFISFPDQIHYYEDSIEGEYYILIFNPDILFGLKDTLYNYIPKNNVVSLSDSADISSLFLSALENYGEYEKTVIVGLLNQAVAKLMTKYKLMPRVKTDNSSLQAILNYCEENYSNGVLSLDTIAENLHLSKYHISHLLNDKLNISFNSYINMLRVRKACRLLDETDKKIIDISEEVGFGSIRSLNRSFLEIMYTTPLKYRKERKQKNT